MEAIEFKTKIKNGTIQIPERYKWKLSNMVKVILINDKTPAETEDDMVHELLTNPIKSKAFSPFTRAEIYERD